MKKEKFHYNIRETVESDYISVYKFVSDCYPLENYSEHVYKILLRYFGNSCFVAEKNNRIIGFVTGFQSQKDNDLFFIWQIGVDPNIQKKGIGSSLLKKIEQEAKRSGCKRIELTVDPNNTPSQKLFQKCGYDNISNKEGKTVDVDDTEAVKDYYKPGSHFILFEKKV